MVTYIDPRYTVDQITAGGSIQSDATPIVRFCSWTVVNVICSTFMGGIVLPADAQIGDVVETHSDSSQQRWKLYPPVGGQVYAFAINSPLDAGAPNATVRCVAPGAWQPLGQQIND